MTTLPEAIAFSIIVICGAWVLVTLIKSKK